MSIVIELDGFTLPTVSIPLTQNPIENAQDVVTLSGALYTDFISLRQGWSINWSMLDEDDYNTIKGIYDSQFSTPYEYPLLTIDYYSIENVPVRMTINEKDIQRNGCWIYDVEVTLTQAAPIVS